jgi:hypothetical protein
VFFSARKAALKAAVGGQTAVDVDVPRRRGFEDIAALDDEMERVGYTFVAWIGHRTVRYTKDPAIVAKVAARRRAQDERHERMRRDELFIGGASVHVDDRPRPSQEHAELTEAGIAWLEMEPLPWTIFATAHFRFERSLVLTLTTQDNVHGLSKIVFGFTPTPNGLPTAVVNWLEAAGVTVTSWSAPSRFSG